MISDFWFMGCHPEHREGSEDINVGVNRSIRHCVPQDDRGRNILSQHVKERREIKKLPQPRRP